MNYKMNNIIKLEELGQFLLAILLFSQLNFAWWVFPACLLLPDVSMLGYLINTRVGALSYNIFHHKLVALVIFILGFLAGDQNATLIGIILFGHSAMDRMFGYGLKFADDFRNTHLGRIGKR